MVEQGVGIHLMLMKAVVARLMKIVLAMNFVIWAVVGDIGRVIQCRGVAAATLIVQVLTQMLVVQLDKESAYPIASAR